MKKIDLGIISINDWGDVISVGFIVYILYRLLSAV